MLTGDTQSATTRIYAKLKDLCHEITVGYVGSMALEYVENGIPFLRSQNVQPFRLDLSSVKFITPEFDHRLKKSVLNPGDVVVVRTGNAGIACVIPPTLLHANCSDLVIFRPGEHLDSYYLVCLFNSTWGQGKVAGTLVGLAQQHFNIGAAKELVIELPPLFIQRKITSILSTWDYAINLTTQLIAAKQQYKRGLMQQLMTGRKRFHEFSDIPWVQKRLGDLFLERRETGRSDLPLLSITNKDGIVSRNSVERRDTSNEDKSRYLRICKGDIGYNTMRMWQGVSAVSSMEGIVSPAYTICIPRSAVNVRFMGHLFKSPQMIHLFSRYSQGMVDDTLSLKFDVFSKIEVTIPCLEEQQRIAEVFDTCDNELKLLHHKLALLKKQKQGLMQQLLTGKVQVKT